MSITVLHYRVYRTLWLCIPVRTHTHAHVHAGTHIHPRTHGHRVYRALWLCIPIGTRENVQDEKDCAEEGAEFLESS